MKKRLIAALAAAALAAGITACSTPTEATQIDSNNFLLCDTGSTGCDGPNPEHGLSKTCFRIGRSIASIEPTAGNSGGLIVTCGEKLPRSK